MGDAAAGWAGDPIVFKLSGWDVPCASLPSTPPTAAVFMTEGSEAVVTVHTQEDYDRWVAQAHSVAQR